MKHYLLTSALALAAATASAEELPAPLTPFVSDYADLLTDAAEAELTETLRKLRADRGIEMAVVLMNSRAPFGPDASDEAFATRLFDTWGIGEVSRNDGILFLVLKDDRFTRIELGKSYGSDWDGTAARILDRNVLPYFQQENFPRGITEGTKEIIETIALPHQGGKRPPREWTSALLFALAGAGIALFAFRRKVADKTREWSRCPNCGQRSLQVTRNSIREPADGTKGQGLRRIHCMNCEYDNREIYPIPMRSSSSGGSFGGGSSGGGGASGRW